MLPVIEQRDLREREKIARIQIESALEVTRCFIPPALAPIDVTGVFEKLGAVWERAARAGQFDSRAIVVAEAMIIIIRQREMSFARLGFKAERIFDCAMRHLETGGCVVESVCVNISMHSREQAPRDEETRITRDCFVEKLSGLNQIRRALEPDLSCRRRATVRADKGHRR